MKKQRVRNPPRMREMDSEAGDEGVEEERSRKVARVSKPILVVLPGSSGKIAREMKDLLSDSDICGKFELRIPPESGFGWNTRNPNSRGNSEKVCVLCDGDSEDSGSDGNGQRPLYMMGNSFSNRVIAEMWSTEGAFKKRTPARVMMCGYPLYSDNEKSDRVTSLKNLPVGAQICLVSGDHDE